MDRKNYHGNEIAVVGMALRVPDAENVNEFWDNLKSGKESVRSFSTEELIAAGADPEVIKDPNFVKAGIVLEDIDKFDAPFFGLNPREASIMDPQHRLFLQCSWEALEDAGYSPDKYPGSIGVFGGCGMNSYFIFNILSDRELVKKTGLFLLRHTGNDKDFLTTRVSYTFGLQGPSINIQTACSTSLVAVHTACQNLLNGECDMALAGGVTIELNSDKGYMYEEGEIVSPDGHCRPFDINSNGTVFGSGAGVVVLKRLEDALNDKDNIHAVIKGSAVNNDGSNKVGYLAPGVEGQASVIKEALLISEVEDSTIDYVETHGTGTPIGDSIEVTALAEAFGSARKQKCRIGSVKANIGHLDTAAGAAAIIKTILSLKNKTFLPSINYSSPNPQIPFENTAFYVDTTISEWRQTGHPRRAGINSLGVGGTNSFLVIEEAPEILIEPAAQQWNVLRLSAMTEEALARNSYTLADYLKKNKDTDLSDATFTLRNGRKDMRFRKAVICKDSETAVSALTEENSEMVFSAAVDKSKPGVVFVFPGVKKRFSAMGFKFYENEEVYRKIVDRAAVYLSEKFSINIKDKLFGSLQENMEETNSAVAYLEVFVTEAALSELWRSWGVYPESAIGEDIGGLAAAYLGNVLTLEEALDIIVLISSKRQEIPLYHQLKAEISYSDAADLLSGELTVSSTDSENVCIFTGTSDEILSLKEALGIKRIDNNLLVNSSSSQKKSLNELKDEFKNIQFKDSKIRLICSSSGKELKGIEYRNSDYWINKIGSFDEIKTQSIDFPAFPNMVFMEVGPGESLNKKINAGTFNNPLNAISTLIEGEDVYKTSLTASAKLWVKNINSKVEDIYNTKGRRVSLPTYSFDKKSYWVGRKKASKTERSNEYAAKVSEKILYPAQKDLSYFPLGLSIEKVLSEFKNYNGRGVILSDLNITTPFISGTDISVELITKSKNIGGAHEFILKSDNSFELFRGKLTSKMLGTPSTVSLRALKNKYAKMSAGELLFEANKNNTVDNNCIRLNSIYEGPDEFITELELAGEYHNEVNQYIVHPHLFNMAVNFTIHLTSPLKQTHFIPESIESIYVFDSLPARIFSRVKYLKTESEIKLNVSIMNERGTELIRINNYKLNLGSNEKRESNRSGISKSYSNHKSGAAAKFYFHEYGGYSVERSPSNKELIEEVDVFENSKVDLISGSDERVNAAELTIDRNSLVTPFIPPRNQIEEDIIAIWEEVLGFTQIGVKDDFIELGGHSLLFSKAVSKVRKKFNVDLELNEMSELNTIEKLSEAVANYPVNPAAAVSKIKAISRDEYKVKV